METDKIYVEILSALKSKIQLAQQRAVISVNTEMLQPYWTIGNDISNKIAESGWGAKIIDNLSRDLKAEFPDNKGFSVRNLKYMRSFTEAYPDFVQVGTEKLDNSIVQPLAAQIQNTVNHNESIVEGMIAQTIQTFLQPAVAKIPWTHHTIILDKVKTVESRLFYIHNTIENGWSKSILSLQINKKLHERQGQAITNFGETLPKIQSDTHTTTLVVSLNTINFKLL
ncbi:DUF1016 N-terminal domain-containing protein [Sphingobacterium faecale]|uniref:YhcG N-terminal domain-containing protein n=1 Tax=Sphingobacterium faecale TaxID=2803775 RepID=A0ABS1R0G5_9SPHI|nr:DUF1016 N-terminal domain-containing protein [Sphingobacterium faecale]MBL1408059.1 hypothetical protein [Sphingobacterium faecale]